MKNSFQERTKNAQFIIISLRPNMFELADHLVGIYKTYNCTTSVTINPHAFEVTVDEVAEHRQNHLNGNNIVNENDSEKHDANGYANESQLSEDRDNDTNEEVIDDSFENGMEIDN